MPNIPSSLYRQLRNTLLKCGPFANSTELKAIFVDDRISDWRDSLPDAISTESRVNETIDFLSRQFNVAGKNALVLLLCILSEQKGLGDACHQKLSELVNELEHWQQSSSSTSDDETPACISNVNAVERSQSTEYYTRQVNDAASVDIITLTMQAMLEQYGDDKLIDWIFEGKTLRILVLAPFSVAAELRSREENNDEIFLRDKIIRQIERLKRIYDRASHRIDNNKEFLTGSLEVRFYDGIPYFAYFGTEKAMAIGLYYSHIKGLQSETISIKKEWSIWGNAKKHFDYLWGKCDEEDKVCVISRHRQSFINLPTLKERKGLK